MITIYKIYSNKGPLVYIGSTLNLNTRKKNHFNKYKSNTNNCSSVKLFNEYGINNCYFEVLEECIKEEKLSKERYWIEKIENCINKNRPIISKEEDIYRRKQSKSENINCECGSIIQKGKITRHLKTNKHLEFIKK